MRKLFNKKKYKSIIGVVNKKVDSLVNIICPIHYNTNLHWDQTTTDANKTDLTVMVIAISNERIKTITGNQIELTEFKNLNEKSLKLFRDHICDYIERNLDTKRPINKANFRFVLLDSEIANKNYNK